MKTIRILLPLLLIGSLLLPAPARAADRAGIKAILIVAANAKGPSDSRLAPYEPTLRRILRFESYRFVGQGSTSLGIPGTASVSPGGGHRLEFTTEEGGGRGLRVRVNWQQGRQTLMETGLVLRPGTPAVLGGPGTGKGGEVFAVIIIGQ